MTTTFLKICVLFVVIAFAGAAFGVSPLLLSETAQQAVIAPPPPGGSVKLRWDAPTNTADIASFRVKWGQATNNFSSSMDVGRLTNATVSGLPEWTTNFFVVVSAATNGVESIYSNITNSHVTPRISQRVKVYEFSIPVKPGMTNRVQWTTNLTNPTTWTTVLTNRNGPTNGVLRWDATNSGAARFYRVTF